MKQGNAKQWWVRLLPVFLVCLTFGFTFENSPDYPDFEDPQNGTVTLDIYNYPSPHYEDLYGIPPFILEWVDEFSNNKTCQEFWSCSKTERNSIRARGGLCFCDDLCVLFGDCCDDSFNTIAPTTQMQDENSVEKTESKILSMESVLLDTKLYKCTYNHYDSKFLYTIKACPKEYTNSEGRKKCEHPKDSDRLLHVPVSGFFPGFKDGGRPVKFYNLYCALCHNVSDYEFWQPKFDCYNVSTSSFDAEEYIRKYPEKNHSIEFIENHLKCEHISYTDPSKMEARECFPIKDNCHKETSEEMQLLCHQGAFHPVFLPNQNNKIYRNIQCVLCNNVEFEKLSCNGTGYLHPNFNTYDTSRAGLSKLYNFNIFKKTCDKNAIYDFFKGFCRPIFSDNSHACEENDPNKHDPTSSCSKCQLIKLEANEYRLSENSIYFQNSDRKINKSLLRFIDDKPYICADLLPQGNLSQSTYPFDMIEVYITTIGLTLSILALLLTFGIYACFRSLRNVPGKMSMNLVASMFLASLIFIFSNENLADVICTVIAVCMHYTYLVSFFWMNALSFDAWNTFSKIAIGGRSKHCYNYYLIYCWITPLLIVLLSIFVQFTPFDVFPPWLSPRYGPPLCWITSKWSLLIFFAAPLFLLILCNVAFYTLTIRAIYRTEKFSDRLLSKKNKGMFLIYLKLCFIMGINWIFALLHTFTGLTIIRYISVFLNSFQGFWVGCSYLCSKQVSRQLKEKLAFMCRSTEHTEHSDLSASKPTSGTYVSGLKSGGEKLMGKA